MKYPQFLFVLAITSALYLEIAITSALGRVLSTLCREYSTNIMEGVEVAQL